MRNTTAVQEGVGGGEWKKGPIPLDQGSWTRDTIGKSGTGAGRRARGTENLLAFAGQHFRDRVGQGHHPERRRIRIRKGT